MRLQNRVAFRIKMIRKRRGLTQESLAERVSRSPDAISQLERGLSLPSFETLERLATALDVPIRDFFDGDDSRGSNPQRDALITALLDDARKLPEKDLRLVVQIAELVSRKKTLS